MPAAAFGAQLALRTKDRSLTLAYGVGLTTLAGGLLALGALSAHALTQESRLANFAQFRRRVIPTTLDARGCRRTARHVRANARENALVDGDSCSDVVGIAHYRTAYPDLTVLTPLRFVDARTGRPPAVLFVCARPHELLGEWGQS